MYPCIRALARTRSLASASRYFVLHARRYLQRRHRRFAVVARSALPVQDPSPLEVPHHIADSCRRIVVCACLRYLERMSHLPCAMRVSGGQGPIVFDLETQRPSSLCRLGWGQRVGARSDPGRRGSATSSLRQYVHFAATWEESPPPSRPLHGEREKNIHTSMIISIYIYIYLSICLSLSIYLSIDRSIYQSIYLYIHITMLTHIQRRLLIHIYI